LQPLTFGIGDLKLRDLAKLWLSKLIMTKSNFKKSITVCRHHNYVSEKRYQNNSTKFFLFGPLAIKTFGYANYCRKMLVVETVDDFLVSFI